MSTPQAEANKDGAASGLALATGSALRLAARERVSLAVAKNLHACQIIAGRDIERVAKQISAACEEYGSGRAAEEIRREHAVKAHGGKPVKKCKACIGNGFYVMSAGDGEWSEQCESCNGTGFVLQNPKDQPAGEKP